ncbi:hypothetical protein TTHERM_00334380 (macronuclear) [Tetrahymena thermophila SB210]|uniref:Uncharacterized protein n=2 Tax=Tetrahymena thermophila (strain SB210) TaxID=312017 RepID=I7M866_TETTS|nr:hypothetical protein TTHERM_00334380 [Tetrahymena thermophila SB210]EAR97261.1 hypothetical protein TTHERM_00334380 [Tetrahymena thermophila SB210]|eukprot:XP_001017506.1 hypothetical protein TTHERM_00334380 [Tetrahymena thermophila SB210]
MSSTSINANRQSNSPISSSRMISQNDLKQKQLIGLGKKDDFRKQSIFSLNQNTDASGSPKMMGYQNVQKDQAVQILNETSQNMLSEKDWNDFKELTDSENTALSLLNEIINKGTNTLYNKYLDQKMSQHIFNSIIYLSELSWQQERLVHDLDFDLKEQDIYFNYPKGLHQQKFQDFLIEDEEPDPPNRENRRNFNVEIEKKQIIVDELDDSLSIARKDIINKLIEQSSPSNSKKGNKKRNKSKNNQKNDTSFISQQQQSPNQSQFVFSNIKETQSIQVGEEEQLGLDEEQINQKYNFPLFQDHNPQIIFLSQLEEVDRVEEQLRLLKEREIELQKQKEEFEALRLKEQKEQQIRLRNVQKGENNKKQIAYDFNGQILGIQPLKTDKLPNSTVVINHNISKGEVQVIDYNSQQTAIQKQLKKKNKQSIDQDDTMSIDQLTNQQTPSMRNQSFRSKDNILANAKSLQKGQTTQIQTVNASIKNKKENHYPQSKDAVFFQQQELFEAFKANKGVTLIEGGRVKKGPNFNTQANSIDISKLVDKDYVRNINLTKNDYNKLVGGLNTSLESEIGHNLSRLSSKHSIHSQSMVNLKNKSDLFDLRMPLNMSPKLISPQNSSQNQNKIQFQKKMLTDSVNQNEDFDQNMSKSLIGNQSANDMSKNNLNISNISKKKHYFSSQKKLQPIDTSKISVQSMEILQTLALDDHEYVLKVLNQNPANLMSNKFKQNFSDFYNKSPKNQKQDNSQLSQSGLQEMHSSRSLINEVSLNKQNQNLYTEPFLNNISEIQSIKNKKSKIQQQQINRKNNQSEVIAPLQRPTDEYNRAIISGAIEWGAPIMDSSRNHYQFTPNFKADDIYKQKHTLGSHGKFPRERIMKKTFKEMSHNHLSPPEIGSTMGHGAGQGFHPDKLVTVKQFIQELNDNQNNQSNKIKTEVKNKLNS